MAARKGSVVGTVRPVQTVGAPFGPGGRVVTGRIVTPPGVGRVWLGSDDPVIDVVATLTGPIEVTPPKPKISTVDRPRQIGLTQWLGQDPYEMHVPLMFDGYPDTNIEASIAALESLAEVHGGHDEPPVVKIEGPIPKAHPHLTWWLSEFAEPERIMHLPDGARCRYATTITLTQRVSDKLLAQSLRKRKKGKGIANRTHVVTAGEDTLFDIAKHAYGDPSRASDIARANVIKGRPLRLAQRLPVGLRLRLP